MPGDPPAGSQGPGRGSAEPGCGAGRGGGHEGLGQRHVLRVPHAPGAAAALHVLPTTFLMTFPARPAVPAGFN